jgi:thiol-disulfide isomerase/thioredoxin
VKLNLVSLEELATTLQENPGDAESLNMYLRKLSMTAAPLADSEPEKAEKMLADARELLGKLAADAEEATKANIERLTGMYLDRLERQIEVGKRLAKIVGMDAAPLAVEAWVNGEPLTDEDLKGKVVLLDFWAVWCGPCIATFPHLREWQEKYAEQGLVIIGLTRYYNYAWDEESGRAARSQEEVAPEKEQEMLVKFAEQHDLHHRFAIQQDASMSDYYAVSGIPHVVVIDQEGKVRLYKIGSGEENAKAVEEMIAQLLAKK